MDSQNNRMLIFGGSTNIPLIQLLHTSMIYGNILTGTGWIQLTQDNDITQPSRRSYISRDSEKKRLLLFGGT